ncbi:MAG: GAF domain-containing protein [Ignavibacteriaceae bacterium]|nr:GAF domain-containing protein [Ignavibacteriaceae bacterium]
MKYLEVVGDSKSEKYESLLNQIRNLINKDENLISSLANVSAALKQTFDDFSWVGFYLFDGTKLFLGPFQGKVACTVIEIGKGVCGSSALKLETLVVSDVHKFEGHIACDSGSNSEIVIPMFNLDGLLGVLDIDSYKFGCFDETDQLYLEKIVRFLVEELF